MNMNTRNLNMDLIKDLEPVEFLGLARVLNVRLEQDGAPRDFYEILEEMRARFSALKRKPRRQINKMLKEVNMKHDRTKNKA